MLPTGTVTLLFTDIEGSTQLLRRLGPHYATALADHDHLLHQAIEDCGGQVVHQSGDGLFAVFGRASDAVQAAVTAQRALAAHPWPESQSVRVRMGLHTGQPRVIMPAGGAGGGDYVGLDVHRAARIAAAAHGGQIVLSGAAEELVAGELPEGVALRDLGEHQLRDLPRPEHVYQLVIAGLPADFPLLRSLAGPGHNLPVSLTSFIGREAELAQIGGYLAPPAVRFGEDRQFGAATQGRPYGADGEGQDGGVRLLTLLGPGGTGKTRLAVQAGLELLARYPDGAWFTDLSGLADGTLVPQAVAGALGLRAQPERPLTDTIAAYLARRQLLLLLDNCEHLLDAVAGLVAACLHAAPGLHILATSREPLGISGEVTLPVPPLPLPSAGKQSELAALLQAGAVRLFVDRARAVRPDFMVTQVNASAVAQICTRLDGMPLAIELAAARMRALTPQQIAGRLDDRFRLLSAGSRTAPPRQQTLEAAIDWSYRLLSAPEQALFRHLSFFAGGWTLEAAEAVGPAGFCGAVGAGLGIAAEDVLDLLARLVDKSLVVADETASGPRYRMLETILAFARARLVESGQEHAVARAHLAYFRTLAEEAAPKLEGWGQQEWLERLETDHDNFRRALGWGLEHAPEDALPTVVALWAFWGKHGHLVEGRGWSERALAVADQSGLSRQSLAGLLIAAGWFASVQGDLDASVASAKRGLALAEESGDIRNASLSLAWLGTAAAFRNQFAEADVLLQRALDLGCQTGDDWLCSWSLAFLGLNQIHQGRLERARPLLEEALRISRAAGDESWSLMPATNLAAVLLLQGEHDLAMELVRDGLVLASRLNERHRAAWLLNLRGELHRLDGALELALEAFREALALARELDVKDCVQSALDGVARVYAALKKPQEAAWLLGATEALRDRLEWPLAPVYLPRHEAAVALLRAQLGGERLAAEWVHGRAMALDDAITLAMAG